MVTWPWTKSHNNNHFAELAPHHGGKQLA